MPQSQDYVSKELFHFVGRNGPSVGRQFNLLLKILKSRIPLSSKCEDPFIDIESGGKLFAGELRRVPALCFCDIPRQSLGIHIKKYSPFGLSFTKLFLSSKGAKPVFYILLKSTTSQGHGSRGQKFPKKLRATLKALRGLYDIRTNGNYKKLISDDTGHRLVYNSILI